MGLIVGSLIDGETTWHAEADIASYHILCGLSLDDDQATKVKAPRGTKINCAACANAWVAARAFSVGNFADGVLGEVLHGRVERRGRVQANGTSTGGYQNRKKRGTN